jgi:UDP-2,3-diacylglucosamine pyrophosphatase LpxH
MRIGDVAVDQGPQTLRKERDVLHSRALFLSDLHLATHACRAEMLMDFLLHNDADTIYLVGDIVDLWRVKRGAIWPQSHGDVVQALLHKARHGTRLVFVPGNHDEGLHGYNGTLLSGIEIVSSCTHVAANGRRLLVMHGDQFDVAMRFAKWLAFLSDHGHSLARTLSAPVRWTRAHFGVDPWSLSAYLRLKVKTSANLVGEFERALIAEARRRGLDGVVCGHIHHAAQREVGDILYLNCGDWVSSCTAIAEDALGTFRVLDWLEVTRRRHAELTAGAGLAEAA